MTSEATYFPWVPTPKQMRFLLAHAERRTEPVGAILREIHVSPRSFRNWKRDGRFMALVNLHRADPRAAAGFILVHTAPDAAASLRATVRDPETGSLRTGRTATDAAAAIFREGRESGAAPQRNRLQEYFERLLVEAERRALPEPGGERQALAGEYREVSGRPSGA